MATVLWAGPCAAISGRTSAELHGFLEPVAGPIDVTGPVTRTRLPGIVFHKRTLERSELTHIDNIPVIGAARTLLDLCGVLDSADCEIALDAALRMQLVTHEKLRELVELGSRSRLAGVRVLRVLVEVRGDGEALSETELESRVIRLLRSASYPLPERQVEMNVGPRPGRVDFLYPGRNLVIEVDGRRWHSGRRPETRDRRRDHALVLGGNRVLRFTWEDVVNQPKYFLQIVGEALGLTLFGADSNARRENARG